MSVPKHRTPTEPEQNQPEPDESFRIDEPLYDPEDTPTHGLNLNNLLSAAPKTDKIRRRRSTSSGALNWLLLGAAALITIAAAIVYLTDPGEPAVTSVASRTGEPTRIRPTDPPAIGVPTETTAPTQPPAPVTSAPIQSPDSGVPIDVVAELLLQPGQVAPPADGLYRMQNPFTVAPARSRSGVISYRVQPNDTLEKIAERFGLTLDTLVWNNDVYVNRLLPGDTLTIPPEDGVLHKTMTEEAIQAIADKYKVSPFTIIDSEFNPLLRNTRPDTVLPPSITVMVVGGVSEKKAVYWNPGITISGGASGASGSRAGGTVSFGGGPGACGAQPNEGGTGSFVNPLPPNYVVTRRFTAYHTGIDLSAPTGTTVFSADSGTVIFAGWSNWGYGNSVVIAHGGLLTLYGHMNSVNVTCGQTVGKGQPVGTVGNTGNSSGPHLHFEIRIGEAPVNPEGYGIAF